jgi:hypothetical protein
MTLYANMNFFARVYLTLPENDAADRLLEAARKGDRPQFLSRGCTRWSWRTLSSFRSGWANRVAGRA